MADQYWVTGTDGKEYGPAPLEMLGQWIAEGRIAPSTPVRKEGGATAEAAAHPELAAIFASRSGAPPSVATAEFRVWGFMEQAWELVKPNWLPLCGIFLVQIALFAMPYLGACLNFIIGGAIMVGIWRAILGMIDGRKPTVGMMFEGFDRFGDAFLAYLVRGILTFLGFLVLIVPGIILSLMWLFTFPVLAETRLGFWEAMHRSAVLTEGYRWRLFLLALACIPVLLIGLLALCLGVLVAMPVCMTAFGLAYRFLQRQKQPAGVTP
jgi:uncharacterized membrane protein